MSREMLVTYYAAFNAHDSEGMLALLSEMCCMNPARANRARA